MFYDKNESNKDFNRSRLASRQFFSRLFPRRLVFSLPTKLETRHVRSNREDRALYSSPTSSSLTFPIVRFAIVSPDREAWLSRCGSSVSAAFRGQRSSPERAFPIDARSVVALVALLLASADPLSTASEAFLPHFFFFTTVTRHVS